MYCNKPKKSHYDKINNSNILYDGNESQDQIINQSLYDEQLLSDTQIKIIKRPSQVETLKSTNSRKEYRDHNGPTEDTGGSSSIRKFTRNSVQSNDY